MLAAVMPLPSEEVTPPVTKTYFATGQVLRGFFQCYRKTGLRATDTAYEAAGEGVTTGPDGGGAKDGGPGRQIASVEAAPSSFVAVNR